jgi:HlyD family secretion protein
MDIDRPDRRRRKRVKLVLSAAAAVAAIALTSMGVSRLQPAAPRVDRSTIWIDTVKRGPLVREVRGSGTLVPEDIRWIAATSQGRVERILLQPGTAVHSNSVILQLVNPELEQELLDAQLKVKAAEAALKTLEVQTRNDYLQQKATAANVMAEYKKAKMTAEMNEALAKGELVSLLTLRQSEADAEQLGVRNEIAKQQLDTYQDSIEAQLAVQHAVVDQARAMMRLKEQRRDELNVRAGLDGILQIVSVDVGQQVATGINLARVANPARLKAEVKIDETQAKDIQVGQKGTIDTRNGLIEGRVSRIDPSVQNGTRTVDVTLVGALPNGAVPDLSIDGTIELERLGSVLYVGLPALGQEHGSVALFRLQRDGIASRVSVKLGRSSVNAVEIVSGLTIGDRVILSDMSGWDSFDRVRVQ